MQKYINNYRGLTLVEILAALIILSLVLIAFMTFFSQSARFTMHNKETLTAVQVAEDVVGKIRVQKSIDILGASQCEDGGSNCKKTVHYDPYTVKMEESIGPVSDYLKKVVITVKNSEETKTENTFITEMYYEVTQNEE